MDGARLRILTTLILFLISCSSREINFDKNKWRKSFDGYYEYREQMKSDLMDNHLKIGMQYDSVIKLLGEPQNYHNAKENEITYEITVDYKWNIDPMEGKNMYIEFDVDSTLTNVRLEHWQH